MEKSEVIEYLATEDGKAILTELTSGLVAKRDELLGKTVALKHKVDSYSKFGEPSDIEAIIAEHQQLKNKAQTQPDSATTAELEHYKSQIAEKDNKLSMLHRTLIDSHTNNLLVSAINKFDGIAELLNPVLASRTKSTLNENGEVQTVVLSKSGDPMFKDGRPATVEDLVLEYKNDELYAGAFKHKTIVGSGTRKYSSNPNSPEFNLTESMRRARMGQ